MPYQEFLRQLGKAGLTIKEFSELVGMNRNSVSNYARLGTVPAHLAIIASLMAELADHNLDFRNSLASLDVSPKRARGVLIDSSPTRIRDNK